MVEKITEDAVRGYVASLSEKRLIDSGLASDLVILLKDLDRFSNWDESDAYFRKKGISHLEGGGPMSKFLRTLAFALEKLDSVADRLSTDGVRISAIRLQNTMSGCSDFHGEIEITGSRSDTEPVCLLSGPFLWDCAAQGLPQSRAAQQLGYRCMVSFPSLEVEDLVSSG